MGRIKTVSSQTAHSWQPLPKGTFNFTIDEVVQKPTKSENLQLVFKMTVADGEYGGKRATHFMVITENTGGFVKEMIEATGIPHEAVELDEISKEDGKPLIEYDFDSDDFVGCTVTADVGTREYDGKEQNTFRNFRPIEAQEAPAPAGRTAQGRQAPAAGAQRTAQRGATPPQRGTAQAGAATRRARV